jgi:hypothetical protein
MVSPDQLEVAMTETDSEDDKHQPRRWIDKREAARHLMHASIRLIMKQEDPFAVHLLINSVDKMLVDLSKQLGKELRVNWEDYIKPEFHGEFFAKIRETYNYLKHADKDYAVELPVRNIMMINISSLFICTANHSKLFGEVTDHMWLFLAFVMNLMPEIITPALTKLAPDLLKSLAASQGATPSEFFKLFEQNQSVLPRFGRELSEDLQDTIDFYHLSFRQIRAGVTESTPILRIPEH